MTFYLFARLGLFFLVLCFVPPLLNYQLLITRSQISSAFSNYPLWLGLTSWFVCASPHPATLAGDSDSDPSVPVCYCICATGITTQMAQGMPHVCSHQHLHFYILQLSAVASSESSFILTGISPSVQALSSPTRQKSLFRSLATTCSPPDHISSNCFLTWQYLVLVLLLTPLCCCSRTVSPGPFV